MLSLQEIFDKVAGHLLKQNARAINEEGKCCLRTKDGKKCAIGVLISDEVYDPSLEGFSRLTDLELPLAKCGISVQLYYKMLVNLLRVHDDLGVHQWASNLKMLAKVYGLKWSFTPTASIV